ncbi:MAG: sensor histidine kinase [Acidimicrobiia bacterium]
MSSSSETTEAAAPLREPIDKTLLTIVVVFRVVGMVWLVTMAIVVLVSNPEGLNSGFVVSAIAVAVIWTPMTALIAYRRPDLLGTVVWLIVDVAFAMWTALAPALAHSEIFFSGGYPISAAFIVAYSHGYPTTIAAGSLIALASAGAFTSEPSPRGVEIFALNVIAPTVVAWTFRVLRRSDRLRLEAEEALARERAELVRAQEREDLAGHLHDSVLQTLALVQQNCDDPQEVTRLARLQERGLRTWLRGTSPYQEAETLAAALELASAEIEGDRSATIEVVTIGDAELDDDLTALVLASREAMLNAAKYAGDERIYVVGECKPTRTTVTVRDKGGGFSVEDIGPDRHGVKDSIIGRVERRGGSVTIRPSAGGGTEVEMTMQRVPA